MIKKKKKIGCPWRLSTSYGLSGNRRSEERQDGSWNTYLSGIGAQLTCEIFFWKFDVFIVTVVLLMYIMLCKCTYYLGWSQVPQPVSYEFIYGYFFFFIQIFYEFYLYYLVSHELILAIFCLLCNECTLYFRPFDFSFTQCT